MIFNPLGFWEKVSKIELFIYTVYTVCFTYICKSKKNISTNFLNIFNFTITQLAVTKKCIPLFARRINYKVMLLHYKNLG